MSEDSFDERRAVPRVILHADAEVVEQNDGARLKVRISELSARGCYVDTLNPLPIGTLVELHIRHSGKTCVVPGKIIYSHVGFGMGTLFGDIAPDQQSVIDDWLGSREET